jgi:anti-sigma B factor antagonist
MNPEQEPLQVGVEQRTVGASKVAIVTPVGEIDLANADELLAVLGSSQATETESLIVDLRQVSFMDSSGLRVLMTTAKDREPHFAAVVGPESAVARLIELVDVADRIHAAASEDEALLRIEAAGADAAG